MPTSTCLSNHHSIEADDAVALLVVGSGARRMAGTKHQLTRPTRHDVWMHREGWDLGDDPPWDPWTPYDLVAPLSGVETRWYVVAGWAIDLFLGRQTRDHEDLEIGVPEANFELVQRALPGTWHVVGGGRARPVTPESLGESFQTWLWIDGAYRLDVFRDPHDGDAWVCRRDPSICRPYVESLARSADGIPYLVPEQVLLYKAKYDRDKDRRDLAAALPSMPNEARSWLRDALAAVHPGHPWLDAL